MKKSLKIAVAASVLASPALAVETVGLPAKKVNMENPLYIPTAGEFYSKTAAGVMYKEADHSLAMQAKDHAGATEWPIYRIYENLGFGITDRLTLRAAIAWTQDDDIGRKGMSEGRLGLNYRIFDGSATDGFVWDMYADAFLGGISPMEAELVASPNMMGGTYPLSFNYDNYANGRYGVWLGTQVGKTWNKFTAAAFAEVERTFGNDNTEITISDSARTLIGNMVAMQTGSAPVGAAYAAGLPETFSVETKSTWEYSAGIKGFYEFESNWGLGGGFTYKHRSSNSIEAVNLENSSVVPNAATVAAITSNLEGQFLGDLQDGWDEYIFTAAVSRKLCDNVQVALYGEYTFDDAEPKSQNGTDVKVEGGVRVNVMF